MVVLSHSSVILRHMTREGVFSLTNFRTQLTTVASLRRKVFCFKMIFCIIGVPTDFPTQSTRHCSIIVLGQVEDCQLFEAISAFREDNLWRDRVNRGSPCSCKVGFDQQKTSFNLTEDFY